MPTEPAAPKPSMPAPSDTPDAHLRPAREAAGSAAFLIVLVERIAPGPPRLSPGDAPATGPPRRIESEVHLFACAVRGARSLLVVRAERNRPDLRSQAAMTG